MVLSEWLLAAALPRSNSGILAAALGVEKHLAQSQEVLLIRPGANESESEFVQAHVPPLPLNVCAEMGLNQCIRARPKMEWQTSVGKGKLHL